MNRLTVVSSGRPGVPSRVPFLSPPSRALTALAGVTDDPPDSSKY